MIYTRYGIYPLRFNLSAKEARSLAAKLKYEFLTLSTLGATPMVHGIVGMRRFYAHGVYGTCARELWYSDRRVKYSLRCLRQRMTLFLAIPPTIPFGRPARTYWCSRRCAYLIPAKREYFE